MVTATDKQKKPIEARIPIKPTTKNRFRMFTRITGLTYDEAINRFLDKEQHEGETIKDTALRVLEEIEG